MLETLLSHVEASSTSTGWIPNGGGSQIVPKCPVVSSCVPTCPHTGPKDNKRGQIGKKTGHFGTIWEMPVALLNHLCLFVCLFVRVCLCVRDMGGARWKSSGVRGWLSPTAFPGRRSLTLDKTSGMLCGYPMLPVHASGLQALQSPWPLTGVIRPLQESVRPEIPQKSKKKGSQNPFDLSEGQFSPNVKKSEKNSLKMGSQGLLARGGQKRQKKVQHESITDFFPRLFKSFFYSFLTLLAPGARRPREPIARLFQTFSHSS